MSLDLSHVFLLSSIKLAYTVAVFCKPSNMGDGISYILCFFDVYFQVIKCVDLVTFLLPLTLNGLLLSNVMYFCSGLLGGNQYVWLGNYKPSVVLIPGIKLGLHRQEARLLCFTARIHGLPSYSSLNLHSHYSISYISKNGQDISSQHSSQWLLSLVLLWP